MRVASVSEARNTLSALLDLVRAGETVVIVDRGVPVAQLQPLTGPEDGDARVARLVRSGLMRKGGGSEGLDLVLREPPPRLRPGHGRAALDALVEERSTGR